MCGNMVTEKAAESTVLGGDYLELYKMLHEERVSLAEEARKLEMAAITAVAALYAWLATHSVHGAPWYIGVPLVMLAAFRAIGQSAKPVRLENIPSPKNAGNAKTNHR
jgi:hypothetical protein